MSRFAKILLAFSFCLNLFGAEMPEDTSMSAMFSEQLAEAQKSFKIQKTSFWVNGGDESPAYARLRTKKLNDMRGKLFIELRNALRETKSPKRMIELRLRLARLYLEVYYEKVGQNSENTQKAQVYVQKAQAIYKHLHKLMEKDPRRTQVAYFLALTYIESGGVSQATKLFREIVETDPTSPLAIDSLAQLGDYHFDLHQWEEAQKFYDQILARNSYSVGYARYKRAWCWLAVGQDRAAIEDFTKVVEFQGKQQGFSVQQQGLEDIALPFIRTKMVHEGIAFYRNHEPSYFITGLERLANGYFDAGNHNASITVFERLIDENPNHANTPGYEARIVESFFLTSDYEGAILRLRQAAGKYLALNSHWADLQTRESYESAKSRFEELIEKNVTTIHAFAQKTKNPILNKVARRIYEIYFDHFSESPNAPKTRFQYAVACSEADELVMASNQFEKAYETSKDDAFKQKALLEAVRFMHLQLQKQADIRVGRELAQHQGLVLEAKAGVKKEFSADEARFLSLGDKFVETYPKADLSPDIQYETSYLRYLRGDWDVALEKLPALVENYPTHASVPLAMKIVIEIYQQRQDYDALIKVAEGFIKRPQNEKRLAAELKDILRHTKLSRIKVMESKGLYAEAGDAYMVYGTEHGSEDQPLYEKALFNGAGNYDKAENTRSALEARERFLREFPNSSLKRFVLLDAAQGHETMGHLGRAAQYFEKYAKLFPERTESQHALHLAALYYWGSGDTPSAEVAFRIFLSRYPNEFPKIRKTLGYLYKETGKTKQLERLFQSARKDEKFSVPDQVQFTLELASFPWMSDYRRNKLMGEALEMANEHPRQMKKTRGGIDAVATLELWEMRDLERGYARARLKTTSDKALQKKMQLLGELETRYAKIAKLGSLHSGLQALYSASSAFNALADEVGAAPVPSNLTTAELDTYTKETKNKIVMPLRKKALALSEKCLAVSVELRVASPWTAKCYALASGIEPGKYSRIRTLYLPAVQTAVVLPKDFDQSSYLAQLPAAYRYSGLFTSQGREAAALPDPGGDPAYPTKADYQLMADTRIAMLKDRLSGTPKMENVPSFAELDLERMIHAHDAIARILKALENDGKNNIALRNLLGLAYLEAGQVNAAEVTWLSMLARKKGSSAVFNNLGIVAVQRGDEDEAWNYFQTAARSTEPVAQSLSNLGFMALKHHNGPLADSYFSRDLEAGTIVSATLSKVGMLAANLQNAKWERASMSVAEMPNLFGEDPFARLSFAYYLLDFEQRPDLAEKQILTFMKDGSSEEALFPFKRVLRETRRNRDVAAD